MKFRFIGGLDCPEWILSQIPEIANTDPNTLQTLGTTIIERIKDKQTEWCEEDIRQFCTQMSADGLRALKAKISALHFIFEKTTKNDCSCKDLEKELLQLGLPSDHVIVLLELYDANRQALGNSLAGPTLKASPLAVLTMGKERLPPGSAVDDPSVGSDFLRMHTLCTSSTDGAARSPTCLLIHRDEMAQLKTCMEVAIKQLESLAD